MGKLAQGSGWQLSFSGDLLDLWMLGTREAWMLPEKSTIIRGREPCDGVGWVVAIKYLIPKIVSRYSGFHDTILKRISGKKSLELVLFRGKV